MIYSTADFMHDTPPRIMGSETEYTTDALPYDKQLDRFLPKIYQYYREECRDDGMELWLENGARLYEDGAMLEYATPECISAHEVAIHERAGEIIVKELCSNAADWMHSHDEPDTSASVYKRSGYAEIDLGKQKMIEMSVGHHENYATSVVRTAEHRLYYDSALSAFLASRSIWAGAGLVTRDGYEFSQKGTSSTFMHDKGKGTHYGQKSAYRVLHDGALNRLEVRIGDGNMSPRAIERKYAVTSLVLRMIEHGDFPDVLQLKAERTDISAVNASRNLPVILRDGSSLGPAVHQMRIIEAALSFADSLPGIPEEEIQAATDAHEICAVVDSAVRLSDIAGQLSDDVDWAAKLSSMASHDINPFEKLSFQAIAADIRWEEISLDGPARRWYEAEMGALADEIEVNAATILPPATRAMARTAVLKGLSEHPTHISWHRIESAHRKLVALDDPYDFVSSAI